VLWIGIIDDPHAIFGACPTMGSRAGRVKDLPLTEYRDGADPASSRWIAWERKHLRPCVEDPVPPYVAWAGPGLDPINSGP
jgi:hypothetical protein